MEIIKSNFIAFEKQESVMLRVRRDLKSDIGNPAYYIFPEAVIRRTVEVLKRGKIRCDDIPLDEYWYGFELKKSDYDVTTVAPEECVALETELEIEELYRVIEYMNSYDPDKEYVMIDLYRISEMEEFRDLLADNTKIEYSPMIQEVLCAYMRTLLDATAKERIIMMMEHINRGYVAEYLSLFKEHVREYILDNITKRMRTEIEQQSTK